MVGFHKHHAVVARKVAKPARFQHAKDFLNHSVGVGYVLINLGANNHINTIIADVDLHGVAMHKTQVLFAERFASVRQGWGVDIDTDDLPKMVREIVIDDATGTAYIKQVQLREITGADEVLTNTHDGICFSDAFIAVEN